MTEQERILIHELIDDISAFGIRFAEPSERDLSTTISSAERDLIVAALRAKLDADQVPVSEATPEPVDATAQLLFTLGALTESVRALLDAQYSRDSLLATLIVNIDHPGVQVGDLREYLDTVRPNRKSRVHSQ